MKTGAKKIIAREFLMLIAVLVLGLLVFLFTFPYNLYKKHQATNLEDSIVNTQKLYDSINRSLNKGNWYPPIKDQEVISSSDTGFVMKADNLPKLPKGFTLLQKKLLPLYSFFRLANDPKIPSAQLYENLKADGYGTENIGSEIEFIHKLKSDKKAKQLYSLLIIDGYTIKSLSTEQNFSNAMKIKSEYWDRAYNLEEESRHLIKQFNKLNNQKANLELETLTFKDQVRLGLLAILFSSSILFVFRYIYYAIRWSIKTLKTE